MRSPSSSVQLGDVAEAELGEEGGAGAVAGLVHSGQVLGTFTGDGHVEHDAERARVIRPGDGHGGEIAELDVDVEVGLVAEPLEGDLLAARAGWRADEDLG